MATEDNIIVQHHDLVVIKSPTQAPHVQYIAEVFCRTSGEKWYTTKRFSEYFLFRQKLQNKLNGKVLKSVSNTNVNRFSLHGLEMDALEHSTKCVNCATALQQFKLVAFPKRKLVVSQSTIAQRRLELVRFLQSVINLAVHWPGCSRGQQIIYTLVSEFIGGPIFSAQPVEMDSPSNGDSSSQSHAAPIPDDIPTVHIQV